MMCHLLASSDERLSQEAQQAQTIQRGVLQESAAIDQLATREGQPIRERNENVYRYHLRDFSINGKVDGITSDQRVVEVKTRQKRIWPELPHYDVVQLQVYLKLTGLSSGILHERCQSNATQERELSLRSGRRVNYPSKK